MTDSAQECDTRDYNRPDILTMLSTRTVQTLFLAVTVLFVATLGWLGWRLLQQDRALAHQRRFEQLEAAADRVSAAIYRRLAELEEALADPEHVPVPSGSVLVRAKRDGVIVRPAGGLLYLPVLPSVAELPHSSFADGESLEFEKNDPVAAAEAFRRLTRSGDSKVKAGALLRLGRSLAKCGRAPEALRAFEQMAAMGETPVGGVPAELIALEATCSLLEKSGLRADLQREARVLYNQLVGGRWPISRASYEFRMEEARSWLGEASPAYEPGPKASLSAAMEILWADWQADPVGRGRRFVATNGSPVLAVWISGPSELTALLAPVETLGATLRESGEFPARLTDAEGRAVLGGLVSEGAIRVARAPSVTRLPWTLEVAAKDDGSANSRTRAWILAGGFALLVGLLAAVSFLAARTTSRELAVARLQSDFVSAVSHEFRSPLSSISQIAELLNDDRLPSDEQRRESFAILGRESARLRRLVEGLLDFARMEAGAARYRLEPLAPGELVRSVVEEFSSQRLSRSREVQASIPPGLPEINADREALGRALWNLLDNAVKYSPVSTPVWVEAVMDDGRLAIRVRDEGPGIPAPEQRQIFRKFVRGSQARARDVKGTGIGLAMVRHIVKGHGGEIRLQSEPGRGSTFTVLLPVRRLP